MGWTLIYKDNVFFRIAQAMTIGLVLGLTLGNTVDALLMRVYRPLFVEGQWLSMTAIVFLLGLLYYTRYIKSISYMSRWPIAVMSGIGTAIGVTGAIGPQIISQITMKPVGAVGASMMTNINNLLVPIIAVAVLSQFIFTKPQEGILGYSATFGRMILYMAFGYKVGLTVMSALGYAIGNMQVLATTPGVYISLITVMGIVISILYNRSR